jgi:adenylosuccinate synthase
VAVTKLDVLGGLPAIQVCTAYRCNGRARDTFPSDLDALAACEPQYEELPGWQEEISEARSLGELPAAARAYLDRVSELIGVPVRIVSVGNERRQTIFTGHDGLFG